MNDNYINEEKKDSSKTFVWSVIVFFLISIGLFAWYIMDSNIPVQRKEIRDVHTDCEIELDYFIEENESNAVKEMEIGDSHVVWFLKNVDGETITFNSNKVDVEDGEVPMYDGVCNHGSPDTGILYLPSNTIFIQ